MKFWKIKHKETGFFYKPYHGYNKNSLSKVGKVYTKKPTLKNISHGYHRLIDGHSVFIKTSSYNNMYDKADWTEEVWEIIEYSVQEMAAQ